MLRGDFAEAVEWCRGGFKLAQSENIPLLTALSAWRLGEALVSDGDLTDGLEILEDGCSQLGSLGHMGYFPRAITALGSAYLAAGLPEKARQTLTRAFQLCETCNQPAVAAEAHLVLAEIEASNPAPDRSAAVMAYDRAMKLSTELETGPLAAHCHLGLSKFHLKIGNSEESAVERGIAAQIFRDLGMDAWLPEADG
jgi:tetratricopeptide (TPR) repeat protein